MVLASKISWCRYAKPEHQTLRSGVAWSLPEMVSKNDLMHSYNNQSVSSLFASSSALTISSSPPLCDVCMDRSERSCWE
eukprot:762631-Hanusia_phi.AAC.1